MPCEFSCLTGLLPGSKLNARLFHREVHPGSELPTVSVSGVELMDVQSLWLQVGSEFDTPSFM
jgi:hypothetical protein